MSKSAVFACLTIPMLLAFLEKMNIKYLLVIFDAETNFYEQATWTAFSTSVRDICKKAPNSEWIGLGALMLSAETGLIALGQIAMLAEKSQIAFRVLSFEESPKWSKYPSDTKNPV